MKWVLIVIMVISLSTLVGATNEQPPQWSDNKQYPLTPTIYSENQTYYFNITWVDDTEVKDVILDLNGTSYNYRKRKISNNGSEYFKEFTHLSAGVYNYSWYARDTEDNWNSTEIFIYEILKAQPSLSIDMAPFWRVSEGTETDVSCRDFNTDKEPINLTLYRNGIKVSNPDIQTLLPGSYIYKCNITETENYLRNSIENMLTIKSITELPKETEPPTSSDLDIEIDNVTVEAGTSKTITFTVKNNGEVKIFDIVLTISNLDSDWYSSIIKIDELEQSGGFETSTVTFDIPVTAEVKDYKVEFVAEGLTRGKNFRDTRKTIILTVTESTYVPPEIPEVIEETPTGLFLDQTAGIGLAAIVLIILLVIGLKLMLGKMEEMRKHTRYYEESREW